MAVSSSLPDVDATALEEFDEPTPWGVLADPDGEDVEDADDDAEDADGDAEEAPLGHEPPISPCEGPPPLTTNLPVAVTFMLPPALTLMTEADAAPPLTVTLATLDRDAALSDAGMAPPQVLAALHAPSPAAEILQEHFDGTSKVTSSTTAQNDGTNMIAEGRKWAATSSMRFSLFLLGLALFCSTNGQSIPAIHLEVTCPTISRATPPPARENPPFCGQPHD